MTRLTRAELVDLVRRLVESLNDEGAYSHLCIEAERALKAEEGTLAERLDSATPVVEWEQRQGSYIHDDGVHELRVYLWGDEWHWHTVVEYRANGTCATEAEAKSAAIAAARGIR
jgi:hypothetical protein